MTRHFKVKFHALELAEIRFHDLRHSVASILLDKNTHPRLVADLLGYSSIKVTLDRYAHIINPMNRVVADPLDDLVVYL
jgi:integrase